VLAGPPHGVEEHKSLHHAEHQSAAGGGTRSDTRPRSDMPRGVRSSHRQEPRQGTAQPTHTLHTEWQPHGAASPQGVEVLQSRHLAELQRVAESRGRIPPQVGKSPRGPGLSKLERLTDSHSDTRQHREQLPPLGAESVPQVGKSPRRTGVSQLEHPTRQGDTRENREKPPPQGAEKAVETTGQQLYRQTWVQAKCKYGCGAGSCRHSGELGGNLERCRRVVPEPGTSGQVDSACGDKARKLSVSQGAQFTEPSSKQVTPGGNGDLMSHRGTPKNVSWAVDKQLSTGAPSAWKKLAGARLRAYINQEPHWPQACDYDVTLAPKGKTPTQPVTRSRVTPDPGAGRLVVQTTNKSFGHSSKAESQQEAESSIVLPDTADTSRSATHRPTRFRRKPTRLIYDSLGQPVVR